MSNMPLNKEKRVVLRNLYKHWVLVIFCICAVITVIGVAVGKYRSGDINYLNSDATWHTLLTIQCYDETPARVHKFLPIVSLGAPEDKFILWGATISDMKGNYYYTSFSPVSFFSAYLFIKIFHLPICEKSLYIFNTFLYAVSTILFLIFLYYVMLKGKTPFKIITVLFTGLISYVFSPELFHGMGMTYWAQSLMQVNLLIQLLAFYLWQTEDSKKAQVIFYIMCVLNPYTEWTGYVANAGFVLAVLFQHKKGDGIKKLLASIGIIIGLTMLSLALFILHFISVVNVKDFFYVVKMRFFARNTASLPLKNGLKSLLKGYLKSFYVLWILAACFVIWNIIQNGKIEFRYRIMMLVLLFPLFENVIMLEHAVSYTFDRMKLSFYLAFMIAELVMQILETAKRKILAAGIIMSMTLLCGIKNYSHYVKDTSYVWESDYREKNQRFANMINTEYADSIITTDGYVRGYLNLLFHRGIYEYSSLEQAISMAKEKNKTYAIIFNTSYENQQESGWTRYKIDGAYIYNMNTGIGDYVYAE